jgi:hypothetical protein
MQNKATSPPTRSTPRHLWIVGGLALLWNCIGGLDFLMTQTRNASYMSSFSAEQLAYFYGLPAWVIVSWALGVWGGVLGSLLLLLRRRLAVPVFALSLLAALATFVHNHLLTRGTEIMGGVGAALFSAVILAIALALLLYAQRLASRSVLR